MWRLIVLALAALLLINSTGLPAHEKFRIIGTVTKVTAKEIEVKTKDNKTVGMDVDQTTIYLRDKTKVKADAVKVGASVVIDAFGDDLDDLVAQQVRIVPSLPAGPAKAPAKK